MSFPCAVSVRDVSGIGDAFGLTLRSGVCFSLRPHLGVAQPPCCAPQPPVAGTTAWQGPPRSHCSQDRPEEGGDRPHGWGAGFKPHPQEHLHRSDLGAKAGWEVRGEQQAGTLPSNSGQVPATLVCPYLLWARPGPFARLPCHAALRPHPENGIRSVRPSLADTRMVCEWLPAEPCDWQLTEWVMLSFHAGGCRAGLFGVPSGEEPVAPDGGNREPCPKAVGQLLCPLLPGMSLGPRKPVALPGTL